MFFISLVVYLILYHCIVFIRILVLSIFAVAATALKLIISATSVDEVRNVQLCGSVFDMSCTSVTLFLYFTTYYLLSFFLVRFWLRVILCSVNDYMSNLKLFSKRTTRNNKISPVISCFLFTTGLVHCISLIPWFYCIT